MLISELRRAQPAAAATSYGRARYPLRSGPLLAAKTNDRVPKNHIDIALGILSVLALMFHKHTRIIACIFQNVLEKIV